jgi:hypothetical protein
MPTSFPADLRGCTLIIEHFTAETQRPRRTLLLNKSVHGEDQRDNPSVREIQEQITKNTSGYLSPLSVAKHETKTEVGARSENGRSEPDKREDEQRFGVHSILVSLD